MRVFDNYREFDPSYRGGIIALGNFDGVHLGHQAVIGATTELARARNVPSGVMTFEPHPLSVFQPDKPSFRLTPLDCKSRLIEQLSIDFVLMQNFSMSFACLSPEDFVQQVLIESLGVRAILVGDDFCFGRHRKGDVEMLSRTPEFETIIVPAQRGPDGQAYSSSLIRRALTEGRPDFAARLLGHSWEIEGCAEFQKRSKSTNGCRAAKLALSDYIRPTMGTYAVRAQIERGGLTFSHHGVGSITPCLNKQRWVLEVRLFDLDYELHRCNLRVSLDRYIGPQQASTENISFVSQFGRQRMAKDLPWQELNKRQNQTAIQRLSLSK